MSLDSRIILELNIQNNARRAKFEFVIPVLKTVFNQLTL